MAYRASARGESFRFADLRAVMAAASSERSGDQLAGIAAESALQRVAARRVLMDLPLTEFLSQPDLFQTAPAKFAKASEGLAERQAALAAAEEEWLDLADRAEG